MEGSGRDIFYSSVLTFAWRVWGKPRESSVRLIGTGAVIRTGFLLNSSQSQLLPTEPVWLVLCIHSVLKTSVKETCSAMSAYQQLNNRSFTERNSTEEYLLLESSMKRVDISLPWSNLEQHSLSNRGMTYLSASRMSMFLQVINGPSLCRVITDKTGCKLLSYRPTKKNLFFFSGE